VRQKSLGSFRENEMSNYITNVCQSLSDSLSLSLSFSPRPPRIPYYITSKENNKWFTWRGRIAQKRIRARRRIFIWYFSPFLPGEWRCRRFAAGPSWSACEVQTNFIFEAARWPFYFIRGSICLCYGTTADTTVGL